MEVDKRKALVETLTKMGINPYDNEIELNYKQVLELREALKTEYNIDVVIKTDIDEVLFEKSVDEIPSIKEPILEYCEIPLSGREKRRERRKLDRLMKKN